MRGKWYPPPATCCSYLLAPVPSMCSELQEGHCRHRVCCSVSLFPMPPQAASSSCLGVLCKKGNSSGRVSIPITTPVWRRRRGRFRTQHLLGFIMQEANDGVCGKENSSQTCLYESPGSEARELSSLPGLAGFRESRVRMGPTGWGPGA